MRYGRVGAELDDSGRTPQGPGAGGVGGRGTGGRDVDGGRDWSGAFEYDQSLAGVR